MGVLKMKKLRLIMLRSKRDELLRELICRGCVEIASPAGSIRAAQVEELLSPETGSRAQLEEKHAKLVRAIQVLEKQNPAIKRLRFGRAPLEAHVLLDDTGLNFALKKAGDVLALDERMELAVAGQQRLKRLIEELKVWYDVDAPLHLKHTESCAVLIGTLAVGTDTAKLSAELEHIDEKSELFLIKEDKKTKYIGFLCMKERAEEMRACLEAKGFAAAPHTDTSGSAMQCSADAAAGIQENAREEEHCRKLLAEELIHLEALHLAADRVSVKIALAEAEEMLYGTGACLLLEAWLPETREAELVALFESLGCAYELAEPAPEEAADVPLLLEGGAEEHRRDPLRQLKLSLRKGRPFRPLEVRTKYYKLAE